jgi:predicted RecA/RadA family phage recombinase
MASAYQKLFADYGECGTFLISNTSGAEIDGASVRVEEDTLVMVLDPIPDGENGVAIYDVPAPGIALPKASGVSFAPGDVVTYDVADGEVNDDTSANSVVGRALKAAAGSDAEVVVALTNEEPVA